MSLIRGSGGHMPCPVCLVPKEKLSDISTTWELRTAAHMQQIVEEARTFNRSDREALLAEYGIRNIDVSLYFSQYSNYV